MGGSSTIGASLAEWVVGDNFVTPYNSANSFLDFVQHCLNSLLANGDPEFVANIGVITVRPPCKARAGREFRAECTLKFLVGGGSAEVCEAYMHLTQIKERRSKRRGSDPDLSRSTKAFKPGRISL